METIIKNIHKLNLLTDKKDELEKLAAFHKRYSNIQFKILKVEDTDTIVETTQGKHLSENYADQKTLIVRTKELFSPFLTGDIHVHATVYSKNPVNDVTPEWVQEQLKKYDFKIVDIVRDTDLDKTNISAWINGIRPMSKIVKAMLYFYFLRQEEMRKRDMTVTVFSREKIKGMRKGFSQKETTHHVENNKQ